MVAAAQAERESVLEVRPRPVGLAERPRPVAEPGQRERLAVPVAEQPVAVERFVEQAARLRRPALRAADHGQVREGERDGLVAREAVEHQDGLLEDRARAAARTFGQDGEADGDPFEERRRVGGDPCEPLQRFVQRAARRVDVASVEVHQG